MVTATSRTDFDASIGRTPLRELHVRIGSLTHSVLLKLEGHNGGGGSIKARTARNLLDRAVGGSLLQRGGTVVESSSGNLGAALAIQGRARGFGVIVVADPNTTSVNLAKIRAAGAKVELVAAPSPVGGYLQARLDRVRELVREIPDAYWPNQYESQANPEAHFHGIGPEICTEAPEAHAIFVPCSTGGTVAGIAARVRAAQLPAVVIPVDVPGSSALRPGTGRRLLTGIGSGLPTRFVHAVEQSRSAIVQDVDAIAACRAVEAETGISIGGSSGAAFVAAVTWLAKQQSAQTAVVVCPDSGAIYDFSDGALRSKGVRSLPDLAGLVDSIAVPNARITAYRFTQKNAVNRR